METSGGTNSLKKEETQLLESATEIAKAAGDILRRYWGKISKIQQKKFYWDLVTEADTESEKLILEAIQKQFPTHKTLSEEFGLADTGEADYLWVIDPLDGTTNYTHQYPMVAVSIGILKNHIPIVGVVYNPILNELFQAAKGHGASLNGAKISVSEVDQLNQSLLATGFAYDRAETRENNYAEFCHMTNHSQGVRRGGSASLDLAYVAAGRLNGYWERGLKAWDIAAGVVLVEEAGGRISSYENGPLDLVSGRILATNGKIHKPLSHELVKVKKINPRFTAFA